MVPTKSFYWLICLGKHLTGNLKSLKVHAYKNEWFHSKHKHAKHRQNETLTISYTDHR